MSSKQTNFSTVLGGRVKFLKTNPGYAVSTDAVWLASWVNGNGKAVLDVGVGTGGVALSMLERCPSAKITGVDNNVDMLTICQQNADLNERELTLINADILKPKIRDTFDIVVTNPPFFAGASSPNKLKSGAHTAIDLYAWTKNCIKRVKPRGYFYTIVDAGGASQIIAACHDSNAFDITVVPLISSVKTGVAERILLRARLGVKSPSKFYAGIIVHNDDHSYTATSEHILRDAGNLDDLI